MKKKADLSIQTIVVAVLALTVLIILIIIFKNQTGKAAGGFSLVGDDALGGLSGKKCQTLLGDKVCGKSTKYPDTEYVYTKLDPPCQTLIDPKDVSKGCSKTGWSDCSGDCFEVTKR